MTHRHDHFSHTASRSPQYDAYYCADCDEWLEPPCMDPTCDFCMARPGRPSEAEKL